MKVIFVGSGSKGNATLFLSGDTLLEIDAGLHKKRVDSCLSSWNKSSRDLQAIFITHNHSDHIKELSVIAKGKTPVYASEGTIEGLPIHPLFPGEGVDIGPFLIMPFSSHHDAPSPLNFVIFVEGMKIGYVTDTGFVDEEALKLLKNCDYYVFESNYEPKMLESSQRPRWLKERIRGKSGHLSNQDCGRYLAKVIGEDTKAIYLAHLSEECNDPDVAIASLEKYLKRVHRDSSNIVYLPLKQREAIETEMKK